MAAIHMKLKCETLLGAYRVQDQLHIRYDTFTLVLTTNEVCNLIDAIHSADEDEQ